MVDVVPNANDEPRLCCSGPHRLSVRTALFQGAERGSTPLGATEGTRRSAGRDAHGAVAQLVRVPVCHTGGRGFDPRQPRRNGSRHQPSAISHQGLTPDA